MQIEAWMVVLLGIRHLRRKMKFAIVNQQNMEREHLRSLLTNYLTVNNDPTEVDVFSDFDSFEEAYSPKMYSLIFLDSPEWDTGVSNVLDYLCSSDEELRVVLVHPPDFKKPHEPYYRFLESPVSLYQLDELLDDLLKTYYRYTRTIKLKEGKEQHIILTSDITYVNIEDRTSVVHMTSGKTIPVRMTFGRVMELIDREERFLLCNRSLAVNMDKIRELHTNSVVLINDEVIELKKPLLKRAKVLFQSFIENKALEEASEL